MISKIRQDSIMYLESYMEQEGLRYVNSISVEKRPIKKENNWAYYRWKEL